MSEDAGDAGELKSSFVSTTGGVMTAEAGAITGDLELLTAPTLDGRALQVYVRYEGVLDLYTVVGSPVRGVSERPDAQEHRDAHERILDQLTQPAPLPEAPLPGVRAAGNERPRDLTDS